MRKKPTRKPPYFTKESAMTAILLDASGKMHRGILFDRRLVTKFKSQFQRGFTEMVVTRAGRLPQEKITDSHFWILKGISRIPTKIPNLEE